MAINVLVADDHEVVRCGLAILLKDTDIRIVAQADDGESAVAQTRIHQPHVVIMDVRMLDTDGLTALEKIHAEFPHIPVIMLSVYDNPTYIARSNALGASDYLLKATPREQLVRAVERAAAGERLSDESLLAQVRRLMNPPKDDELPEDLPLTTRELQVLRHLALGLNNREIGRSLSISLETVKEHVQNILRKIDATDRTQAAVWAVKRGLA